MTKKILVLILTVCLVFGSFPVTSFAADELLFAERFDGIATNGTPDTMTLKCVPNARVSDDGEGNKAFMIPGTGKSSLDIGLKGIEESFTVSFKIKMLNTRSSYKMYLVDSANRKFAPAAVLTDGTMVTHDNKAIGGAPKGSYVKLDVGYNTQTKKYFVAVNDQIQVSDWLNNTDAGKPATLRIETGLSDESNDESIVFIDDIFVKNTNECIKDVEQTAYNTEVLSYEEQKAIGDKVYIQKDFEDARAVTNGFQAIESKGDTWSAYYDEENDRNCLKLTKTQSGDPFFDTALTDASQYFVMEAEFMLESDDITTEFFRITDENGNVLGLLQIHENQALKLLDGTSIGTMPQGRWTKFAAAVDMNSMNYDIYMNGKLVKEDIDFSAYTFGSVTYYRTHFWGSSGSVCIDNFCAYDGKEPRVLEVDAISTNYDLSATILPDNEETIAKLNGTVAFKIGSDNIFIRNAKQKMDARPYETQGTTMVPVRAISEAFNINVDWDETKGKITIGDGKAVMIIGNPTMTVGDKKVELSVAPTLAGDRAYIPLRALCEEILDKKVTYFEYGTIIVSDNDYKYKDDTEVLKDIDAYLYFNNPSPFDIQAMFDSFGKAGVHPRVIGSRESFAKLREDYKTNSYIKTWGDAIIAKANSGINAEVFPYSKPDGVRLLTTSQNVRELISNLGIAYQITGNKKYAERVYKEIENVGNYPDWNPSHFLDTSEMMLAVAVGYDLCYDAFSDDERRFAEQTIIDYGLSEGIKIYYGGGSGTTFPNMTNNWNIVCNGGMTAAAMAIADVELELASFVAAFSINSVPTCLRYYAPSGAWAEGPDYWAYATEFLIYMTDALRYSLGTDYDVARYTGMTDTAQYMLSLSGNKGSNNFHDSVVIESTPFYTWLGNYFGNNSVTSARLYDFEVNPKLKCTWQDLLWLDTSVTDTGIYLPLDMYYSDVEAASMRSSWKDKSGTYVGFHGGATSAPHGHIDTGAFVLDMLGERWASDLGPDDYNAPGYFDYEEGSGRWQLYKLRAEGHNTLVINPSDLAGQDLDGFAPVVKRETKSKGAYMILDMSDTYKSSAVSARRGYMLTDNRESFVMRDEIDLRASSELYWFMHTEADIDIVDNNTAVLSQNGKRIKVDVICNVPSFELKQMQAKALPTSTIVTDTTAVSGYKKLAIHMNTSGKVEISVRFTPMDGRYAKEEFVLSNMDSWTLPDGELSLKPSADMIFVNCKALADYLPEKTDYELKIPYDYEKLPRVTAKADGKIVNIVPASSPKDKTIIEIKDPADELNIKKYYISYYVIPKLKDVGAYLRYSPEDISASEIPEAANPDTNAFDDDISTRWAAEGVQWIEQDLGSVKSLDAVALAYMNGNQRHYKFRIEVSLDGVNYTTIYTGESSAQTNDFEIFEFTKTNARYVRYQGSGSDVSAWNSITEFAALAKK